MPSKYLTPYITNVVNDFIERYRLSFNKLPDSAYDEYKTLIQGVLDATLQQDPQSLGEHCRKLAQINSRYNIPYIVMVNELNAIKNRLTAILLEHEARDEVFALQRTYHDIENVFAYEYLHQYMTELTHANTVRMNSLKDLLKKDLIMHYQSHLEWLNALIKAIDAKQPEQMPELEADLCRFGCWLHNNGKAVISNNSKYTYLVSIHQTLHALGGAIHNQMQKPFINYNILMSYLEKCEFISLSIGTELALIDNRNLVKDISKDPLTGALNRNALESVFSNHYELALATDSHFVMAMCDLDYFKMLNDQYGHLAGDKVLKSFVATCKHLLRESDIIIRYGGEEFIILMSNTHLAAAADKLDQLRREFNNLCCTVDNQFIDVSVSIGAIEIKPNISDSHAQKEINTYIQQADIKLYQAKEHGRNRVVS